MIAIDPGPKQSAWILWGGRILDMGIDDNEVVLGKLSDCGEPLVIEWIESFGMPVGRHIFETVYWIGRFAEAAGGEERVTRKEVKEALCGSHRAKDPNIRQALMDRFPATGGGSTPQVGTKAQPGPLFGIRKDLWSALAVAVTYEARQ